MNVGHEKVNSYKPRTTTRRLYLVCWHKREAMSSTCLQLATQGRRSLIVNRHYAAFFQPANSWPIGSSIYSTSQLRGRKCLVHVKAPLGLDTPEPALLQRIFAGAFRLAMGVERITYEALASCEGHEIRSLALKIVPPSFQPGTGLKCALSSRHVRKIHHPS